MLNNPREEFDTVFSEFPTPWVLESADESFELLLLLLLRSSLSLQVPTCCRLKLPVRRDTPSHKLKLKLEVALFGIKRSETPMSALDRFDGRIGVVIILDEGENVDVDTSDAVLLHLVDDEKKC